MNAFAIPEPHGRLDVVMDDRAVVRLRVHGNPAGPRLLLSHGNGFAIDGYYPFWRLLLDDFEVLVYDQRNHGANPRHREHSIARFVSDMETIRQRIAHELAPKATAGLFHSVSAITALFHAAAHGPSWDALVLFDPPIVPAGGHPLQALARGFELYLAQWAKTRPRCFADPEQLAEQFRRAKGLRRWLPDAASLMARAVTRLCHDGGYELSCPPECESAIYAENAYSTIWQRLPAVRGNVFVLGSDPEASDAKSPAKIGPLLPAAFGFRHAAIPDTSHLLQIERPEACVDAVRQYFRAIGFAGAPK